MEQEDAKARRFEDCSKAVVIGACIEVHRHLGPGLLESAYEHCVAHEFFRETVLKRVLGAPILSPDFASSRLPVDLTCGDDEDDGVVAVDVHDPGAGAQLRR